MPRARVRKASLKDAAIRRAARQMGLPQQTVKWCWQAMFDAIQAELRENTSNMAGMTLNLGNVASLQVDECMTPENAPHGISRWLSFKHGAATTYYVNTAPDGSAVAANADAAAELADAQAAAAAEPEDAQAAG